MLRGMSESRQKLLQTRALSGVMGTGELKACQQRAVATQLYLIVVLWEFVQDYHIFRFFKRILISVFYVKSTDS